MPIQGQQLSDPSTGNSVTFLETAADTGGARVVIRQELRKRGRIVPDHVHAFQTETFEVESGVLTCTVRGERKQYQPGERVSFPPGTPHNHFNEGAEPLVMRHTTEPALDFDVFIENLFGLMADGKIVNGNVPLLQNIAAQRGYESKAYIAGIPFGLQRVLGMMLAPAARLFGYRAVYARYSGFER